MGEIRTFIYCLRAEALQSQDGQAINANGVLTNITPEYVPGTFSFSIIFSIAGMSLESHMLRVNFVDINGKILVDSNDIHIPFKDVIEADKNGETLPDDEKGMIMTMDLRNVVFEKDGYYQTRIYLDGSLKGEYKIYAKGKNRL